MVLFTKVNCVALSHLISLTWAIGPDQCSKTPSEAWEITEKWKKGSFGVKQ